MKKSFENNFISHVATV